MDLSQFSTEDLQALKGGDLSKVSTAGLQMLRHAQVQQQIDTDPISQGARDPSAGMGVLDKFNAGAGKAFSDIAQGVGQRLGLVSRDDVAETRRLDAPLMKNGAAVAGNVLGNLSLMAPASLAPGAQAIPGATALGATIGYLQPSASVKEDMINTGLGGVGGAAGQYVSNIAGRAAVQQGQQNAIRAAAGAQKAQAAEDASKAGYVIPPEDVGEGGGILTRVLSGVGGKIKTAQVASQRNQDVTNGLVRQALGISDDTPLTAQTLAKVRSDAGAAYDALRNTGNVAADAAYTQALDDIANKFTKASQAFPGAVKSDVPETMAALKQPQFSADGAVNMLKILRANADQAFAGGDKDKGAALKGAADALEGMLERHTQAIGNPDLLQQFRDARQLIAKTYSVQKGLNSTTGDVAASALAKQLDKGKPLSDELLTVAQAGQAFPKATQALKEAPKAISPLDIAVASIKGDPLGLLTLGARPAARSILLSRPMQNAAVQAAGTPQPVNPMLRLLSNDDVMVPLSIESGNALARQVTR
jgi:hypothetical protein